MQKLFVLVVGVATAVGLARAEVPETLGLWTFDGESGTPVADGFAATLIPNKVVGADVVSLWLKFPADTSKVIPPIYTNEVQHAYLFGDPNFTNLLATCASSLFVDTKINNGNTYGMPHGFLRLEGTGAALQDCSFTLEAIVRLPTQPGWTLNTQFGTNVADETALTFYTNGKCGAVYTANTPTKNLGKNKVLSHTAQDDYFGLDDDRWHHYAVAWDNETKKLTLSTDYHVFNTIDFGTESLALDLNSVMTLWGSNGGGYNYKAFRVQAIRLTRGDLPKGDRLQTSPVTQLPETAVWWRFGGTPGETFCETPNVALDRTDLCAWTMSSAYAHVAAWKPYVKADGEVIENVSGVGMTEGGANLVMNDGNAATWNPYLRNLSESFTCELFLRPRSETVTGGRGQILGEAGGAGGNSVNQGVNWMIYQQDASDRAGFARLRLSYQYWDGDVAKSDTDYLSLYVTTNDWHHLAVTYDKSSRTFRVFVDYKAAFTKAFAENQSLARGVYMSPFGAQWFNNNGRFPGDVDEFRRTRRALDVSEFLKPRMSIGLSLIFR